MKYIILTMSILTAFIFIACDFPAIFSGEKQLLDSENSSLSENLLFVEITGGIAGINQRLIVDESGKALYSDSMRPGAKWVVQLSPVELDSLVNLLIGHNFFQLDSQYIDNRVADAFIYAISFTHANTTKTIATDYFGAPENLKKIVDGLLQVINRITENGLDLVLEVNSNEVSAGEKMDLKLIVTNISDKSLTLHFTSGQIFDFFAVPGLNNAVAEASDKLIWNWAHDRVFTQNVWDLILESGEQKSYQVTWDGRDNAGNKINGEILVVAELVSTPGGSSEQQKILINGATKI